MFKKHVNNDKSKVAPVIVTAATVVLSLAYAALYFWIFQQTVQDGSPSPLILVLTIIPIVVIVGVFIAMTMRMKEIDRGELDEAKKY